MAPVQIKVVYDYYSAKRTTLFFITEEELLNLDFNSATVNALNGHLMKIAFFTCAFLSLIG